MRKKIVRGPLIHGHMFCGSVWMADVNIFFLDHNIKDVANKYI